MSEPVLFGSVDDHRSKADALYGHVREQVLRLVPSAVVEHVGSTALPDGITKGDLDVQVRVRAEDFDDACRALASLYEENSGGFTDHGRSFKDDSADPPLGVHVTVIGGPSDVQSRHRDLLQRRPDLRAKYAALKRRFDGGDMTAYRHAKEAFFMDLARGLDPSGLVLRDATVDDYPVFARLFPELGVEDPVLTREQFTAQMLPKVVVLGDANGPTGYAFWRTYGRTAHVSHVVVDPLARGRGLGRALMEAVRQRVIAEGCTRWSLNVKQDNAVAVRLYGRCGFTTEQQGWALRAEWSQLQSLPEPRGDVVAFTPTPEDDPAVAARFGETPEHLANLRGRAGVVLVGLREAGRLVGFAALDPSFPSVRPVHVARVELARCLFDSLRPQARHDHVHVTLERNRALYEALASSGATTRHSFYRMGGVLT